MALPASQQQGLDAIESEFRIADPKLIRAFAAFGGVTGTTGMPPAEQVRRRRARAGRHRRPRSGRRQAILAWVIGVVVVSLLMTAGVMLNLSHPRPAHCTATARPESEIAQIGTCPPDGPAAVAHLNT